MVIKRQGTPFSVVVPAYNSAAFIRKCIDSVLGQSCPHFELILVDDGSTDDTQEICRTYARNDPRVKVIHKENGGHTSARNEGLKNAEGEYVLFLDSDDWLAPQTLELCQNEISACEPDVVFFRMQNSDGKAPYRILVSDGRYDVETLKQATESDLILGADGGCVFPKSLSGKCFKREVVYGVQMEIPKEISIGEDGAAFVGAMLQSKTVSVIAHDVRACYYCLIRANSVSRSADLAAFSKARVLLSFYHEMLKEAGSDYAEQFNRDVVAQLYTAALLVIRSGGKGREISDGLKSVLKDPLMAKALKKAKFNRKGYKFIIKQFILRYRLWSLAKLFDKVGK